MTSNIGKYPKFSEQVSTVSGISINGSATKWVTVPYPSGHTPIAVCGYYINGSTAVTVYSIGLGSGGSTNVALRNTSTGTVNFTLTVNFLCVD